MAFVLHEHQAKAIEALRASLRAGYRRPMLQAPTGYGKGVLAAAISDLATKKQSRMTITVPAVYLVDQMVSALGEHGVLNVGVIQGDHMLTNSLAPVQVASVQTLERRAFPESELVLVDEAHRDFAVIRRWMDACPRVPFIGQSATPWTRGLGKLYDTLIVAATTKDLIEKGFLCPFRVFAPDHPDLSAVRTVAGDYEPVALSKAMGRRELVGSVVRTWLERGEDRPTLVFGVDKAHAKALQDQFLAAGVAAGYVDGETDDFDRRKLGREFASGDVRVVCNVGVLTTGVDWDVRCIVLARPTKSEILYVQMMGRGLRTAPGKKDLLILDHSDTTLNLGFVSDIHHDTLDDGRLSAGRKAEVAEPREPKPRECRACTAVVPPRFKNCPACGTAMPVRPSDVVHKDGTLVELDEHRKPTAAMRRNRSDDWMVKADFIGQLRAYAIEKGRSSGWVAHKYRARYGVWPNDPHVNDEPATAICGEEVRAWIKAMDIRFARERDKAAGVQKRFSAR